MTSYLLHNSGTIDAFVHTTNLSHVNTIYSKYATATDFIDLYINTNGSVTFALRDQAGATETLSTTSSTIGTEVWYYVSLTWSWDETNTRTDFSLQVDNNTAASLAGSSYVAVEDSASNTAYLAIAFDLVLGL
jgi:hypothetical protein